MALQRVVKELLQANDIVKTASVFFTQAELDQHGNIYNVDPICKVLQIPSYVAGVAQR